MREKILSFSKLTKDECIMLGFSACHGISSLFLDTFVISFLMHNAVNEFISVSVYKLFFYFTIMLTFVLMTNWCKRGNIKFVFSTHLLVQMFFVIFIAICGNQAANWFLLLGVLYGIDDSLRSMASQQMVIDKIRAKRMVFYCGTSTAITNIIKIVVPVILGALITITSFQEVAWILIAMHMIEFYMLFILSPINQRVQQCADLAGFMKKSLKVPCMRKLFAAEAIRGFAFPLETLGVMYIVSVFHTDMNLGIWTTVFAICAASATWLFGHLCTKRDFKWIVEMCSLLLMGAIASLVIDVNYFSIVLYTGALTVCIALMDQVLSVNVLNLAKTELVTQNDRAEYIASRQVTSFLGRWIGIVGMLYMGIFSGYALLPYFIIILAIARIIAAMMYVHIGKYICNE